MLKKKSVLIITALLMVIAMLAAGCGQKAEPPKQEPAKQEPAKQEPAKQEEKPKALKIGTMFSIPDPANAGGWDRAQYAGLMALKSDLGAEVSVAENVPYPKISESATSYLDKGYDMIIYPDNGMIESFKEMAPKYPDNWMVMVSKADELPDSPKVAAYSPDFYAYGNMVGIAAAKASKSGTIGVLGGAPIPVLKDLFSGIIEGAKTVNPNANVIVYWAGDWVDTAKHREITLLQIKDGADVIFTVTGPAAAGVYEAAESKGAKVIGYAHDLYEDNPKAIMTSLMIDFVQVYKEIANNYKNGTLEKKIYNLGAKFFKFADFRGSVPADVEKEINDTVEKIKSGELKIPVKLHDEIMK